MVAGTIENLNDDFDHSEEQLYTQETDFQEWQFAERKARLEIIKFLESKNEYLEALSGFSNVPKAIEWKDTLNNKIENWFTIVDGMDSPLNTPSGSYIFNIQAIKHDLRSSREALKLDYIVILQLKDPENSPEKTFVEPPTGRHTRILNRIEKFLLDVDSIDKNTDIPFESFVWSLQRFIMIYNDLNRSLGRHEIPTIQVQPKVVGPLQPDQIANSRFIHTNIVSVVRAIENLLENSYHENVKATKREVMLIMQNGKVTIIVHDNGIGIAPWDFEHKNSGSESTGMGLSIVHKLISDANGSMKVFSRRILKPIIPNQIELNDEDGIEDSGYKDGDDTVILVPFYLQHKDVEALTNGADWFTYIEQLENKDEYEFPTTYDEEFGTIFHLEFNLSTNTEQ